MATSIVPALVSTYKSVNYLQLGGNVPKKWRWDWGVAGYLKGHEKNI